MHLHVIYAVAHNYFFACSHAFINISRAHLTVKWYKIASVGVENICKICANILALYGVG